MSNLPVPPSLLSLQQLRQNPILRIPKLLDLNPSEIRTQRPRMVRRIRRKPSRAPDLDVIEIHAAVAGRVTHAPAQWVADLLVCLPQLREVGGVGGARGEAGLSARGVVGERGETVAG